jgi:sugar O-acyltransferase (sialic acid O-acetyltransferase NeuD family)
VTERSGKGKGRRLVIFGATEMAERVHYYVSNYTDYDISGFTVAREYITSGSLLDLPVWAFEELPEICNPKTHDILVAVGYSENNRLRERIFTMCEGAGYRLGSFVSPSAAIQTRQMGSGVLILDNATVGPFCSVGKGTIIGPNSVISHHSKVGEFTYMAPSTTICGHCNVGARVFLGAGCTLRDQISVADGSIVGAGALVSRSIDKPGVYAGNPARWVKDL